MTKKSKRTFLYLLFLYSVSGLIALKAQEFQLDNIMLRGSGCPEGTTTVVPSPDNQTISILFDQMISTVPQYDGNNDNATYVNASSYDKNLDYKVCDIVLDTKLKRGEMLVGLNFFIQSRGAVALDVGTRALFKSILSEVVSPFSPGRTKNKVIMEKEWVATHEFVSDDYTFNLEKNIGLPSSGCAANGDRNVRLQLKNILGTRILPGYANSATGMLTMDSTDMRSTLKMVFVTRPCAGGRGNGRGNGGAPSVGNGRGNGGAPGVGNGNGNPHVGGGVGQPGRGCVPGRAPSVRGPRCP